jgi:hypothetical protein
MGKVKTEKIRETMELKYLVVNISNYIKKTLVCCTDTQSE